MHIALKITVGVTTKISNFSDESHAGNRVVGYNSTIHRNIYNQNHTLNPNPNLNNTFNNNAFGGISGSSNPVRPIAQGTPQYNNNRNNQWQIGNLINLI